MDKAQLKLLQDFTTLCKNNPAVLHLPELSFYREWLESLGAKIPPPPSSQKPHTAEGDAKFTREAPKPAEKEPEPEPESPESDFEADMEGVIQGDDVTDQVFGDESMEVTDEMIEQSQDKRSAAQAALSEGNYEEAIQLFTEAIKLNPATAALYAKRASIYIKMQKPNAAIKDCDKALEINSDQSQAYKWRGMAHRLLGHWEDAVKDLGTCCKIDFDADADATMKEILPKAKRVSEHRREKERKQEEKELKARQERVRKAQEEHEKRRKEEAQRQQEFGGRAGGMPFGGGMGGGMPFGGGMGGGMPFGGMGGGRGAPGGGGMPDLSTLLSDPELLKGFQDPEVAAAFTDISQNPANIAKYQNNPKVKNLMDKLTAKMGSQGGGAGMGGGAGHGHSHSHDHDHDHSSCGGHSHSHGGHSHAAHNQPDID